MLAQTRMFDLEDLPEEVRSELPVPSLQPTTLEEAEKQTIISALTKTKNKTLAARTLRISRPRLYRLMEKYGLSEDSTET